MNLSSLLFFLAHLFLLLTCLILLGIRILSLRAYSKKDVERYFPDNKLLCVFLGASLFQLPYLFRIYSESAFLYITLFDFLLFVPSAVLLWERRFYRTTLTFSFFFRHLFMPILLLVPLFIGAIVDYKWPAGIRTGFLVCSGIVFTIGLLQLYRCVVLRYKYVSADLSRGFILSTYVILSMRMVIIVAEFSIMNPWMKMYCDLLFSFFTFYTVINGIVLQRLPMKGATDKTISTDLSEGDNLLQIKTQSTRAAIDVSSEVDELTALGELIHQVIREKELFRQPHLKLSSLCEHLPSNRTYVSAAINKIDNRGFYGFILSFRIDYACKLMKEQPDMRIEEVALCAGFSSQKIFSRLFRQEMGMSPSVYRGMQVVKDEKIILVATE